MQPGPQAVAQRKTHVVLDENLADIVEALVQKILFMMVRHPLRQDRAAPAHNAGNALGDHGQILNQDAGMDGHIIHALLRLLFDHFQHHFGRKVLNPLDSRDGFINRHGADGHRGMPKDRFADLVDIAASGEIHHGIGAVVYGRVQLVQFVADLGRDRRIPNVGVDLAQGGHANAHGLKFGMIDVGGNDHAAAGDFIAD